MEQILLETIDYFCDKQLNDFKKSELYQKLKLEVEKTGYIIILEVGCEYDKPNSYNRFLSVSIHDEENHLVELPDEGNLTTATQIVLVDKKNRFVFSDWNDIEFIDDIENWIIKNLKIIRE